MSAFKSLEENKKEVYIEITEILLKILDNVIKNPDNLRYRKLRLANYVISNKLMLAIGAMECLFLFGFEEADDMLVLPQSTRLATLKQIRDEFNQCRKEHIERLENKTCQTKRPASSCLFFEELSEIVRRVLKFEDKDLQALAKKEIPIEHLKQKADKITDNASTEFEKEFSFLLELMKWFKFDYFQWMNSPICEKCNSSSTFTGYNHQNKSEDIDRIEIYSCNKCKCCLTFPRYNDPRKLLITRTGRCGEWASCFALFCRCLDYETRYILDKTDHVWIEVYSQVDKRWIHCDPCENSFDAPLLYEKGWNKSLSYVIAFSREEVQDVTWRYITKFADVLTRRKLCTEENLVHFILQKSSELQTSLPLDRINYLQRRRVMECAQFLTPLQTDQEYSGRISGSLQWRQSRNECNVETKKYTWKLNATEGKLKQFSLKYSTSTDTYHRKETNELIEGWQNGVFECESIFKKVELDWKMCYLCRKEGTDKGIIKWKFSSEEQSLPIDKVKIKYQCTTFHSGAVTIRLCNEDTCVTFEPNVRYIESDAFTGSYYIIFTATLIGGDGKDAWQHAQLFRQSLDDTRFPFEISITFLSATYSDY